ncbi:Vitamin B12 transporter BtuB [Alcanivorax sp. ALC70]|nr:Vitamin B12 transporter BtuB [Alcanivorax sp. ALC70]
MKKPNPPAALCLPLALLCSAVQADDTPSRFELGVLEPVVVDGTRADFSDATTEDTVDADDMARFNRTDVSQALELLPGVNTVMMGGRSERLINVRGFDSRQVPLFIDGVPVYVPYDGNIDLSRLTTYDVAEISLSKGYTSLLAGPNTLGGAINVVSRRPRLGTEAEAGYGMSFDDRFSHNAWDSHANVGTNQGLWYAQVGGSIRDQDYFPLAGDFEATADEDGGRRENSQYTDRKLSLRLGFTPNASDEYVFSYYKQDGEKQTPPYAGDAPTPGCVSGGGPGTTRKVSTSTPGPGCMSICRPRCGSTTTASRIRCAPTTTPPTAP